MALKSLSLPLAAIVLLMPLVVASQTGHKKITLEDDLKKKVFAANTLTKLRHMNDGKHYCLLNPGNDSILEYDYQTGKLGRVMVAASWLIPDGKQECIDISDFTFSDDESKILFATESDPIYRYSESSVHYIYDLKTSRLYPLSMYGKQRVPCFSGDGTRVAFVRGNNLFIRDLSVSDQYPIPGTEIQITFDGKMNEIINGVPDWVYEEEFGFLQAYQWSPDGTKLAFYRFDETRVKDYELATYGSLYPEYMHFKYPKAGEENSVVRILIFDLNSKTTIPVDLGKETDIYIPRIKWTQDTGLLALYRLNRHQNKLELLLADAATGNTRVVYTEENNSFIDIDDNWRFMKDNGSFLLTSEKDGYNHIYQYDFSGNPIRQLTRGNWEVTKLIDVDEKNGLVYYQSTEISPLNRDTYAISLDGKIKNRLTTKDGWNSSEFSATFDCFINTWSDIFTPYLITVNKADGALIRIVEDNVKLKKTTAEYGFSKPGFFTVKTVSNIELNGWMLKPADFDPLKRYPVLFTIYGGPGSQEIKNSWRTVSAWHQLLAQNGIIVVSVDPRGTAARGEKFKKLTLLQIGKYETEDLAATARYIGALTYIDSTRIGVWGWSYGGFMVLNCLTRASGCFSMGVSIAPVTHYKYYNDIYTERFMRTPKENPKGYEDNAPLNYAGNLRGKLLLVHGMSDDNVHPQNSYDMVTELIKADKQFEMQLYPNNNHNIRGGTNTRFHLYRRMTEFILKNL